MIGTITNNRIAVEIGEAFGAASSAARHRLERSRRREEQGQPGAREETYTEDLMDAVDEAIREHITAATASLARRGSNVRVEFEATKAPQSEEADFGLDLGIRAIIDTPGYSVEKAILVQCKRMYGSGGDGTFRELRGRGEDQAAKMLAVTPASFLFLFSAGEHEELWRLMGTDGPPFWPDWFPFWPDSYWARAPERIPRHYFDPGVSVVPATRVLAASQAARHEGRSVSIRAAEVLQGAAPLGHFMAALFGPCLVGDPRSPILQLATPPSLREAVHGLEAEVPELDHLRARRFHSIKFVKGSGP